MPAAVPRALQSCQICWAIESRAHLRSEAGEVFQVAADPVGLLDDGVDVQLRDLLHQAIFITFSVLKH